MTKRYEHRFVVTFYSLTSDVSGMDVMCLSITMFPNCQGCFQGCVGDGKKWPIWGLQKNLILMAFSSHWHNRVKFHAVMELPLCHNA